MEAIIFEMIKAGNSGLAEKLTVFMVAWFFVKRAMKEHLGKIETGLASVAMNLGELKEALTRVESIHSTKINNLEAGLNNLKGEVLDLKRGTDGKGV